MIRALWNYELAKYMQCHSGITYDLYPISDFLGIISLTFMHGSTSSPQLRDGDRWIICARKDFLYASLDRSKFANVENVFPSRTDSFILVHELYNSGSLGLHFLNSAMSVKAINVFEASFASHICWCESPKKATSRPTVAKIEVKSLELYF